MKKKIASLLLFVTVLATGVFANPVDENLSGNVLSSFSQRFTGATAVSWSKTDKYVKASFQLNNQVMFAYFTHQGELLGVTRNMLSDQLPVRFQQELKKLSANYWISELFELASPDQTSYYVTIENANQKIFLSTNPDHSWVTIKRVKKD